EMHAIWCGQRKVRLAGGVGEASRASRKGVTAGDGRERCELARQRSVEFVAISSRKYNGPGNRSGGRVEDHRFLARESSEVRCVAFRKNAQEQTAGIGYGANNRALSVSLERHRLSSLHLTRSGSHREHCQQHKILRKHTDFG